MPFTPVPCIIGGLCIGLSAFWNARLYGRVTGISGLARRAALLDPSALPFIAGLLASGALLPSLFPAPLAVDALATIPPRLLLPAGLLVGAGTALASGCTSGHAVCGLARLSPRSAAATAVFMAVAMLVATTLSTSALYPTAPAPPPAARTSHMLGAAALAALAPPALVALRRAPRAAPLADAAVRAALGAAFGAGLLVCGMAAPAKTAAFLDLGGAWDASLPFVFVGALPVAAAGFGPLAGGAKPALAARHQLPRTRAVTARLLVGAALFGAGWGAVGLCPGPAIVYAGRWWGGSGIWVYAAGMAVGTWGARVVEGMLEGRKGPGSEE